MGDVRILTSEAPIETDGDFLDLTLSSGARLHSVSVFPITASVETTNVTSLLFQDGVLVAGIIVRDTASSNASTPQPAVCFPDVPLPQDRTLTLRTIINNATGAAVIWRVTAIVELN